MGEEGWGRRGRGGAVGGEGWGRKGGIEDEATSSSKAAVTKYGSDPIIAFCIVSITPLHSTHDSYFVGQAGGSPKEHLHMCG